MASRWRAFDKWITKVTKGATYISVFIALSMMVISTIDVILTKFINLPIVDVADMIAATNTTLVFMSIAYVQLERGHLYVLVFEDRIPAQVKFVLRLCGDILGMLVMGFIAWRLLVLTQNSITMYSYVGSIIHFPQWVFPFSMVLGSILMVFACFLSLIRELVFGGENTLIQSEN